nr:site-specific integrase [Rubrimonas cliftonensis]
MRAISLRTDRLPEAMVRAQGLDRVLEAAWERIAMETASARPLTPGAIDQIIDELLVRELARMIGEHEEGLARTRAEADAALKARFAEQAAFREEARLRDYERAKPVSAEITASLGYGPSPDAGVRQTLYARTFTALRQLNQTEVQVEEGASVDEAAASANIAAAAVVSARQAARGQRITVSQAFEKALAVEKSADNRHHIASAMRVALAAWGDAPLSAIGREEFLSLLLFARRLPIDHGRKHGRNRYKSDGVEISKHDEIARADRQDAELRATLDALELQPREREARLQAGLTRRLNEKTLKKVHSFVRLAFRVARNHLGYAGPELPAVLADFRVRAKTAAQMEYEAGADIAQRQRVRASWSDERLMALFNSPLYRGHQPKRRHTAGKHLTRDSLYWTPLIAATMGMRPQEILQLRKRDVVRRNGVYAVLVAEDAGTTVKTEAGRRYVPVPEVLLKLGFIAWVNEKRREDGLFLFDDIEPGAASDRLSGIFGGRFTSIRKGLGILDENEDFYALRRTFNSRLAAQDVKDSDCAALLGHKQKDITNLHYTDREIRRLKTLVDMVNYHFEIAPNSEWGFPVLTGCRLDEREKVAVTVERYDDGNPMRVTIFGGDAPFSVTVAPVASWPCFDAVTPPNDALAPEAAAGALIHFLGDRAVKFSDAEDAAAWEHLMSHAFVDD